MTSESLKLSDDPEVRETHRINVGDRLTTSIGLEHSIETAISDLIDNSIGARASHVNIQFVEDKGRVIAIRIRDNGAGMDYDKLREAMDISPDGRVYEAHELSMFGIGLKASSLGQANVLSVYTSTAAGQILGTRMVGGTLQWGELSAEAAAEGYRGASNTNETGTVIEWSSLKSVSKASKQTDRHQWLAGTISRLSNHLGLVFHRFIEDGDIRITIDVMAAEVNKAGPPRKVRPINPFSFENAGHQDFPVQITTSLPRYGTIGLDCHIIPPGSRSESARIMGQDRSSWQGLYVYWRRRLIHFADWANLTNENKDYQLARVRIDLSDSQKEIAKLNPAKNGVVLSPVFVNAVHKAQDSSGRYTFTTFLETARDTLKTSNKRIAKSSPITRTSSGLPSGVVEAIANTVGWRDAHHQLDVDWTFLPEEHLFKVDYENRKIRLNSRHRVFLSSTASHRHEDAPIVRTLLFLLLEQYFKGAYLQQNTIDQIEALREILSAAMVVQLREIEEDKIFLATDESSAYLIGDEDEQEDEQEPTSTDAITPAEPDQSAVLDPTAMADTEDEASGLQSEKVNAPATFTFPEPVKKAREATILEDRPQPKSLSARDTYLIASAFRKGSSIPELANEFKLEEESVAFALAELAFGEEALENDVALAAMHDIPWTPTERERAESMAKSKTPISQIAQKMGRTSFDVAWKLLDSPKPPQISSAQIKHLRPVEEP